MYFEYGEKELTYLKKKDKKLAAQIERIGLIKRETTEDVFETVMNSIVSQQIAKKAAITVWDRFQKLTGEMTPKNVAALTPEQIQACGMSMRKANYIHSAATADIDYKNLSSLEDEEILKQLTALPGIGVWTVEMLLIFCLKRMDIVSWGDFAIRKGMMMLYGKKELTKKEFERYAKRYSPYGSVASLYLWHISQDE